MIGTKKLSEFFSCLLQCMADMLFYSLRFEFVCFQVITSKDKIMVILSQESKEFHRQELAEYLSGPGLNWKFRAPEQAARVFVSLRARYRCGIEEAFIIAANGDAELGEKNYTNEALQLAGE